MTTYYVDTSILLRVILRQRGALPDWARIRTPLSSAIIETEVARGIDQARHRKELDEKEAAAAMVAAGQLLAGFDLVEIDRAVRLRAGQPEAAPLRTLDALHLATALLWKERVTADILLATHDTRLGAAARAHGLEVIGV
jgi:predicted nucleic acid-binding protein